MALAYDRLNFPVLDTLQPKHFNNLRRKVGRPAKVGPALCTKGPNNVATINEYIETGNEEDAVVVINWPDTMDDTVPQNDHLIDENDATVDNTVHVDNTFPIDNTVPLDNLELDGVTISIDDVEFINDSVPMDNDSVTDTVPLQNINMDSSKQKNNQIKKRCEVCQKEVNIKSMKQHQRSKKCQSKRLAEDIILPSAKKPRMNTNVPAIIPTNVPTIVGRLKQLNGLYNV